MNGIKMSDCKFYVDEEARTVVCVIPNTKDMVIDYIFEHYRFKDIDFSDALYNWHNPLYEDLIMPSSFMGKAVCAKEDEWNEDTGRLIAYSRARTKCYKSFFKRANRFVQAIDARLNDIITGFNEFGEKLTDKDNELQKKIDEKVPKE